MFELPPLFDIHTWLSLIILSALEIVLGIDNLVFISILSNRLPKQKQKLARRLGLAMALITRLLLLASMKWMIDLVDPLFMILNQSFSGRDLLLLLGGIYLIFEGTREIHSKTVGDEEEEALFLKQKKSKLFLVVTQIMFLDIVFSLDSVITAVGMAQYFIVMAFAVVIAVILMMCASEPLHRFIHGNPTIEVLALCFLLLIGTALVADGFHFHINRAYIYFAIIFSVFVESINITVARKKKAKKIKV